jgi:hypothetical protein
MASVNRVVASIFDYVAPGTRTPDSARRSRASRGCALPRAVKRASTGAAIRAGNDRVLVAVTAADFDHGVDFNLTAILAPAVMPPICQTCAFA